MRWHTFQTIGAHRTITPQKSMQFTGYGGPEKLRLTGIPQPTPGQKRASDQDLSQLNQSH
jgi:hypothetical protein